MKLDVVVNGAAMEMEILESGPQCRFRIADEERRAEVESPEPGVFSILLEGRSYDAAVERTASGFVVVIDGHRFEVAVHDPRRWSRKSALSAHGVATLAAPMPGKVVRVLAAAGDQVEAGQGIVVVEAMKMQNEMKAPRAGRLVSISASEGATVTAGEILATIE